MLDVGRGGRGGRGVAHAEEVSARGRCSAPRRAPRRAQPHARGAVAPALEDVGMDEHGRLSVEERDDAAIRSRDGGEVAEMGRGEHERPRRRLRADLRTR